MRRETFEISNHYSIQHLQPLESCGPSNHLSHDGFIGPVVLSIQNKSIIRRFQFFLLGIMKAEKLGSHFTQREVDLVYFPHYAATWYAENQIREVILDVKKINMCIRLHSFHTYSLHTAEAFSSFSSFSVSSCVNYWQK